MVKFVDVSRRLSLSTKQLLRAISVFAHNKGRFYTTIGLSVASLAIIAGYIYYFASATHEHTTNPLAVQT